MENKDIHDLNLHETTIVHDFKIMRVPSGWMYNETFVPYSAEFKDLKTTVNPKEVRKFLEDYFKLKKKISTKTNDGNYPLARQVYCKILKTYSRFQNSQIARDVGFKSRAHVNNSMTAINNRIYGDKYFKTEYEDILRKLKLK